MTEHRAVFANRSDGVALSGTLTLPATGAPGPAAILVHGQGPLDRDMCLAHLRPFKVLAEHLAAGGIASLRYDKRGVGESGGNFGSATREDLAGDVLAAVRFLTQHEAIAADRVGLIGLSEGGVVAPMVASASEDIAESIAPHVINERTNMVLGGPDLTAEQFIGLLSSPCLQETIESTPETFLSRLLCPVLALFAGKDRHVPAAENMAAMKRSLEAACNRDYTVETIAGCNHLFQRCETGYPDEYFTIDHDISPDVLDRVNDWIGARVFEP